MQSMSRIQQGLSNTFEFRYYDLAKYEEKQRKKLAKKTGDPCINDGTMDMFSEAREMRFILFLTQCMPFY
jgi:hypothetical protein